MTTEFIKKATHTAKTGEDDTREIVNRMLQEIEAGGEDKCAEYAKKLDGYTGDIVLGKDFIEQA